MRRNPVTFWLFLLPALALYGLFFLSPFLQGFYYSMTDWNGWSADLIGTLPTETVEETLFPALSEAERQDFLAYYRQYDDDFRLRTGIGAPERTPGDERRLIGYFERVGLAGIRFIGFDNFLEIFTKDQRFVTVLSFSLWFTVFNVIFLNAAGLGLALLLDRALKGRNLFRSLYFLPNILGLIIVGYIWVFVLRDGTAALYRATGWEWVNIPWLTDNIIAPWSVLLVSVWQGAGYIMVIYLAGLQSIGKDVLEAAAIDGTMGWRRFVYIIFPLLMPSVTVAFFITITNSLKTFEIMYALTRGGPGAATTSYVLNIFTSYAGNRFGYATAQGILLLAVIMVITGFQLSVLKKKEVEL